MNRRLLVVEPDAPGRAMLDRVLTAAGYTAEDFSTVREARLLLDDDAFDLAVVDQLAGAGATLDEVRLIRARYPKLPVVVTGTMLTAPVLIELMRMGVADALPKPFTPTELRDAVKRSLVRATPGHLDALTFEAALYAARRATATRDLASAARALSRAWSELPLDSEVVALEALRAELEGRDDDASRGYRAALALRHDAGGDGPDPHEGLARLSAYAGARPVAALGARFRDASVRSMSEVSSGLVAPSELTVVVAPLSLASDVVGPMHVRERGDCAFVLFACDERPERVDASLAALGLSRRSLRASENSAIELSAGDAASDG